MKGGGIGREDLHAAVENLDLEGHRLCGRHAEPPVGTPRERETSSHLVVRVALLRRRGDEVAQAVRHPLAVDRLDRLHHVRVAAQDETDVGRGEQLG